MPVALRGGAHGVSMLQMPWLVVSLVVGGAGNEPGRGVGLLFAAEPSRQKPAGQWSVRKHRDTLILAEQGQVALDLPLKKVVSGLNTVEAREVAYVADPQGLA